MVTPEQIMIEIEKLLDEKSPVLVANQKANTNWTAIAQLYKDNIFPYR